MVKPRQLIGSKENVSFLYLPIMVRCVVQMRNVLAIFLLRVPFYLSFGLLCWEVLVGIWFLRALFFIFLPRFLWGIVSMVQRKFFGWPSIEPSFGIFGVSAMAKFSEIFQ